MLFAFKEKLYVKTVPVNFVVNTVVHNTVLCLLPNLLEQSLVTKLAFEWFLFLMN